MRGFIKTGDLYVDSYYGNDTTGDGSKEKPYATMGKAYTEASSNDMIVLSGFFEELLTYMGKTVKFTGDGFCLISGASLSGQTMFAESVNDEFTDIIFFNFTGSNYLINTNNMKKITNCTFYYCNIYLGIYTNPFFHKNVLVESYINFDGYITGNYTVSNNTFYHCAGNMLRTQKMIVVNNHFEGCETMLFNIETIRPPGSEFDYNNIIGDIGGSSNDDLQALGGGGQYQMHGLDSTTNQFNVDNSGFGSTEWWKYDFTLTSGSDNVNAAKDGKHIGARSVGYRFSANALWTARNTGTVSNLQYNSTDAVIERVSNSSDGSMETNEMDLGTTITTDLLNVFQQLIDGAASSIVTVGKVDYNADPSPDDDENQKITMDLEMQYGTSSGSLSGWKKFEAGKIITIDASADGNAEATYDPDTSTRISFRYFKLRFKLVS